MPKIYPAKLQHLVIFTKDLEQSHQWYKRLFGLQFSAKNHPDSSAAMRLIKQTMHFFSFGFYHHDLALVSREGVQPDNTSLLNYAVRLKEGVTLTDFVKRLEEANISYRSGRLLKSANLPEGYQAVCFKDPNGYWIEILGKP